MTEPTIRPNEALVPGEPPVAGAATPLHDVTFREALGVWSQVALQSFGGPAGQIAVMHRILVERKKWISEERFLHALNYCMLLPGPEAQQLATYIGWLLHGLRGGLAAGLLFILPGIVSILALSVVYVTFGDTLVVPALFFGLKAAVLAVVFEAVQRIGKRALRNRLMWGLAAASFVAIYFFEVPFPAIIAAAALVGYVGGRRWPELFQAGGHGKLKHPSDQDELLRPADRTTIDARPSLLRSLGVVAIWSTIWWGPQVVLWQAFGTGHVFVQQGLFFSEAAMFTFGGAYSVLSYIGQRAVDYYHWLSPREMLDGLGMAETTPGPLIMVVQFVGFLAAYRFAPAATPALSPMSAGICGALLTTWVTFAPCFLWIFLGAPYIEYLRNNRSLSHALSGITAAVVGVILNLAIWFGLHVVFGRVEQTHVGPLRLFVPDWPTIDWAALAIAVAAGVMLLRWKRGVPLTLAVCTALGAIVYWLRSGAGLTS